MFSTVCNKHTDPNLDVMPLILIARDATNAMANVTAVVNVYQMHRCYKCIGAIIQIFQGNTNTSKVSVVAVHIEM